MENANKWISKLEQKLNNPDSVLEQSNLSQLSLNIQRLTNDLNVTKNKNKNAKQIKSNLFICSYNKKETQSILKSKQEIINKIRELCDTIAANKARLKYEIANLKDILDAAEDIKQRYRNLFIQISDR